MWVTMPPETHGLQFAAGGEGRMEGGTTLVLSGHRPEEMRLISSHIDPQGPSLSTPRAEKYRENMEILVAPNDQAAILH